MKYRILSKDTIIKPVFKSYEEFEKWRDDFNEKVKDKLEENRIKRRECNRFHASGGRD